MPTSAAPRALRAISTLLLPLFFGYDAHAAELRLGDFGKNVERGQAEYFNSNRDQRFEIKVNLVGGVQTPGIYHLPDTTNLIEAISLAGGTVTNADLGNVYVKHPTPSGFETHHYDLSKIISNPEMKFPQITDRDTILIETTNTSQNLVVALSIIGSVLGILTTGYLFYQSGRK